MEQTKSFRKVFHKLEQSKSVNTKSCCPSPTVKKNSHGRIPLILDFFENLQNDYIHGFHDNFVKMYENEKRLRVTFDLH